jgi:regulator of sirC expression with transglutaminase-like and TPR domain
MVQALDVLNPTAELIASLKITCLRNMFQPTKARVPSTLKEKNNCQLFSYFLNLRSASAGECTKEEEKETEKKSVGKYGPVTVAEWSKT